MNVHVPWEKRVTPEHRAEHARQMKEYRAKNRDKYLERERRSKLKVPEHIRRQRAFKHNLWDKYKITPEHYYYLLDMQDGRCAICQGTNGEKRLDVDHDHSTGQVRGLLCHTCNMGMIAVDAFHGFCAAAKQYKEVTYRTVQS